MQWFWTDIASCGGGHNQCGSCKAGGVLDQGDHIWRKMFGQGRGSKGGHHGSGRGFSLGQNQGFGHEFGQGGFQGNGSEDQQSGLGRSQGGHSKGDVNEDQDTYDYSDTGSGGNKTDGLTGQSNDYNSYGDSNYQEGCGDNLDYGGSGQDLVMMGEGSGMMEGSGVDSRE